MLDAAQAVMGFLWSLIMIAGALGGAIFLSLMMLPNDSLGSFLGRMWARCEFVFWREYHIEKRNMSIAPKGDQE
jgi:hypothetical protein